MDGFSCLDFFRFFFVIEFSENAFFDSRFYISFATPDCGDLLSEIRFLITVEGLANID